MNLITTEHRDTLGQADRDTGTVVGMTAADWVLAGVFPLTKI